MKFHLIVITLLFFFILFKGMGYGCSQDPNTLTPQMHKAYDQLKKACEGEFGKDNCTVSIRCGKEIL